MTDRAAGQFLEPAGRFAEVRRNRRYTGNGLELEHISRREAEAGQALAPVVGSNEGSRPQFGIESQTNRDANRPQAVRPLG